VISAELLSWGRGRRASTKRCEPDGEQEQGPIRRQVRPRRHARGPVTVRALLDVGPQGPCHRSADGALAKEKISSAGADQIRQAPRPCSGGFSNRSPPDRLMRCPTPMPPSRKPCRSPLPCMRAEAKAALARKDVSTGQGLGQALPSICSRPATPRRDAPKRKWSAKSTPTGVLRTGADDDCCSPLPDTRPPDSSSSRET